MSSVTPQQNIPNGWKHATLGKVASVTNGSTNTQDAIADGEYPLFDRSVEIKRSNKYLFDDTAIILPGEGAEFVPRIYSGKFDLHQRAYAIFPDKNIVIPGYLYHFLYANRKTFVQKSVGSTVKSLRLPLIQSIDVSIPPIKEQQKIAEILGTVDEDITKTQEVLEATEKLKRGLMQQLFTRGIGNTKFKDTKIGQIPESWSVVPVSEVVKKIVDNRGKTPPLSSDGVGMIEVNAIDSSQKYPNYSRISKYVSQETYDSWFRNGHPEKGDILIPTVGTVGVAVIMNENKGCIAQNIIAVRVKDTILPDFFYYLVISPLFVDQIRKVLMGAVQPSLKVPHMLAFNIPLPTKPEQREIAEILSAVDEKISINKKLKENLTLLKKGLMQDLLSGKVRTI